MITASHSSLSLHLPNSLHRLLTGVILFLVVQTHLRAQATEAVTTADTLLLSFRADSTNIDLRYDGNSSRWAAFEEQFNRHADGQDPARLHIDIYAGASPEGPASRNEWLGRNRGAAIRRLVRRRLGNKVGNIEVHNEGPRWADFRKSVEASSEPWRDEVLSIIDMQTDDDPNSLDTREKLLRKLDGGKTWAILRKEHLAPLRSGAKVILTWETAPAVAAVPPVLPAEAAAPQQPQAKRDTIVIRDTLVIKEIHITRDTIVVMNTPVINNIIAADKQPKKKEPSKRDSLMAELKDLPAWALKTNALLWGIVTPNIELEVPLGRNNRWSLEAEYFIGWYTWAHNAHAHQFHNLGAELRYWPGRRQKQPRLQGWHIGMAAAIGYYDWEWKKSKGYQGEYLNAYLNLGYQYRWNRHWAIDAAVGAGIWLTKYRHYYGGSVYPEDHLEPWDEHLIYHDQGRFHWIGPSHASIALVYLFNAWPFKTKTKKQDETR